jgi:hypothetical protein
MVTNKDIDDAKIPFDDEITNQSDFDETFLAAQDADAKRRSKPRLPINPLPWDNPHLYLTPSPSRNISRVDEIPAVLSMEQANNAFETLGEIMARAIEDGRIQEKDVSPIRPPVKYKRYKNKRKKKK